MGRVRLREVRYGWLVALVLTVSILSELPLGRDVPYLAAWWTVPGGILLAVPAILAPRWPVRSAVAAAVALVGLSVVVRLADERFFGRITLT